MPHVHPQPPYLPDIYPGTFQLVPFLGIGQALVRSPAKSKCDGGRRWVVTGLVSASSLEFQHCLGVELAATLCRAGKGR